MKSSSLLALQIALFHYYPADAAATAFVQNNNALASRKPVSPHRQALASSSSNSDDSAGSTTTASSSIIIIELPSAIPKSKRHPLFRETNAVSKTMPVPHPNMWRRYCLPSKKKTKGDAATATPSFWDLLSPRSQKDEDCCNNNGGEESPALLRDEHVRFTDPTAGARRLLEQCGIVAAPSSSTRSETTVAVLPSPETIMAENETIEHLAEILSYFQSIASHPSSGGAAVVGETTTTTTAAAKSGNVECIARAVSTVGTIGIKCPRWHADHVPVRLVMSVLGPGCEYIPEDIVSKNNNSIDGRPRLAVVNREALNNLDEDDTLKANDIIVPPDLLLSAEESRESGTVKHAKEGEAVLLMGRGWEDRNNNHGNPMESERQGGRRTTEHDGGSGSSGSGRMSNESEVLAAVHRSPTLLPEQERILLTVDLADWDY